MGNTISYTESPHKLDLGAKGKLSGTNYSNKAIRYAGVPYALPPTGENRWRKPISLPTDHIYAGKDGQPFDATSFHPPCCQAPYKHAADTTNFSEDCLRLNIWTPDPSTRPVGGWPTYIWLHGGWFQIGDPSQEDGMSPVELISTGGLNAIVVVVGYRLNVFGFLSGAALLEESAGEAVGNYGLWDQRCALEWVRDNIELFGGNPQKTTLAGRSAGSYSVQAQMLHEFRRGSQPADCQNLFRRVFMCSNAIPAQPKTPHETQVQFDELLDKFDIDKSLSGSEQLQRLRAIPANELVSALKTMKYHTFRPVTDNIFIHPGLVEYQISPKFATDFQARNFRLLIGEVLNEETLYATYNSPTEPTLDSLRTQLQHYYAPATVERILSKYALPKSSDLREWKTLFGTIVADGQVCAPSRLVVSTLLLHGVSLKDIWRYQIAYRFSFITEDVAPLEYGVAHATDRPIWNFSIMHGPTEDERRLMKEWIADLVAFVQDDGDFVYGTAKEVEFKVMTPEGRVEVRKDERYGQLVDLAHVFCGM